MTIPTQEGRGVATAAVPKPKGLQAGAVNALSSFMISVASVGPALVLTAILGVAVSIAGPSAAGVMLLAALPIFGIILAYSEMNRESRDCGTTFVWVSRALGPTWGFLSAWGLVGACLLIMPASAFIVTVYTFSLFGLNDLAEGSTRRSSWPWGWPSSRSSPGFAMSASRWPRRCRRRSSSSRWC